MIAFDEYQQQVVNLYQGRHTVFASAGSGKTEVLTKRLENIIQSEIELTKVLCLTFTNRAAESMKERAQLALGNKAKNVFIGNIHALGYKLIAKHKNLLPYYSLAREDDIGKIWQQALKNTLFQSAENIMDAGSPTVDTAYIYKKFSIAGFVANKLSNDIQIIQKKPADFSDLLLYIQSFIKNALAIRDNREVDIIAAENYISWSVDTLFNKYHSQVQKVGLDSLLFIAFILMKNFSSLKNQFKVYDFEDVLLEILTFKTIGYQWVQVDEVQDFSPLHWLILNHHCSSDAHVLMFGDLNQSIYRFMGANINVTKQFVSKSAFELPNNYRSPKTLVSLFDKYMKCHFSQESAFNVISKVEDTPNALIHLNATSQSALDEKIANHCNKLASQSSSAVAILCHSNKAVSQYSQQLSNKNIPHFRVSQHDILQTKAGLDFSAYMRVFNDVEDFSAWSRMLWNLAIITQNEENIQGFPPQLYAFYVAAVLLENKIYLSDFAEGENIYDHQLKQLFDLRNKGYVYFDTETTGLDPDTDNIIQIAAVKVLANGKREEIDLYCSIEGSVGDSYQIHKISDDVLAKYGKPLEQQLNIFLDFVGDYPLVAHNLTFDEQMLISAFNQEQAVRYEKIKKYCSLILSRRFFPQLKSHTLGYLLEEFGLEGVNSHNALDDVKAGSALMNYLIGQSAEYLDFADTTIESFSSLLSNFQKNLKVLKKLDNELKAAKQVTISDYISLLHDYVEIHRRSMVLDKELYQSNLNELNYKLSNWFNELRIKPNPKRLRDFIAQKIANFKETDLITENDKLVISTVHRSKGLEFDYVILPDVTTNSYPSYPIKIMPESDEKDALMDEQKRVLYVAMTRTKKQLIIGTYERNNYGYSAYISDFIYPVIHEFRRFNF